MAQTASAEGALGGRRRYDAEVAAAGLPPVGAEPLDLAAERASIRRDFAHFHRDSDEQVTIKDTQLGPGGPGSRVRCYLPSRPPRLRMLWMHGGAFSFGEPEMDDDLAVDWARRHLAVVAAPDYRLAPEHRFPAGEQDCLRALTWLDQWEVAGEAPLVIAGASAGGSLALRTALRAVDAGVRVDGLVLVYPVIDPTMTTVSMGRYRQAPVFDGDRAETMWHRYLDGMDPDAYPSPLRDDRLGLLPPTLLITAEHDPLRDEGLDLLRALLAANVSVQATHFAGVYHAFDRFAPGTWPADELRRAVSQFLGRPHQWTVES